MKMSRACGIIWMIYVLTAMVARVNQEDSICSKATSKDDGFTGFESVFAESEHVYGNRRMLLSETEKQPINYRKRKLKIGVPVNNGFPSLVDYSADVFAAAVNSLPEAMKFEYEFVSFPYTNSSADVSNLLKRVAQKELGGAVADTTITADRSSYVDFTSPYSDDGIGMIVSSTWEPGVMHYMFFFLKPFSLQMWAGTVGAIIFTFAFLYLLHWMQVENAQNIWKHWKTQMSTIFGNGESRLDLRSILVVMIFGVVTPMMISVYAGSYSSQIIADYQSGVLDLNATDVFIGYQFDSTIVKNLLLKKLYIDESKIKGYKSFDEYEIALSKGSARGGVSVIIDETPYLKLFLAKYGSIHYLDGRTFRSPGFGFAFPLGSQFATYVSKGIVNITENGEMEKIEKKYFGVQDSTANSSSSSAAYQIRLVHFAGLYFFIFLFFCGLSLTLPEVINWLKTARIVLVNWLASVPNACVSSYKGLKSLFASTTPPATT